MMYHSIYFWLFHDDGDGDGEDLIMLMIFVLLCGSLWFFVALFVFPSLKPHEKGSVQAMDKALDSALVETSRDPR